MTPKRVLASVDLFVPPVRLYLDDLQHLVTRLTAPSASAVINVEGFEYASVEELAQHRPRQVLKSLEIVISTGAPTYGQLWVTVRADGVRLHGSSSLHDLAAGIARELRLKSPWYSWHPGISVWWNVAQAISLMLLLVAVFALLGLGNPSGVDSWSGLLVIVVGSLAALAYMSTSGVMLGGTWICLATASEMPGFWQRNRDTIITSLATSALIGIGSFFLGKAVGK